MGAAPRESRRRHTWEFDHRRLASARRGSIDEHVHTVRPRLQRRGQICHFMPVVLRLYGYGADVYLASKTSLLYCSMRTRRNEASGRPPGARNHVVLETTVLLLATRARRCSIDGVSGDETLFRGNRLWKVSSAALRQVNPALRRLATARWRPDRSGQRTAPRQDRASPSASGGYGGIQIGDEIACPLKPERIRRNGVRNQRARSCLPASAGAANSFRSPASPLRLPAGCWSRRTCHEAVGEGIDLILRRIDMGGGRTGRRRPVARNLPKKQKVRLWQARCRRRRRDCACRNLASCE